MPSSGLVQQQQEEPQQPEVAEVGRLAVEEVSAHSWQAAHRSQVEAHRTVAVEEGNQAELGHMAWA